MIDSGLWHWHADPLGYLLSVVVFPSGKTVEVSVWIRPSVATTTLSGSADTHTVSL
jgi:hypothetical protein